MAIDDKLAAAKSQNPATEQSLETAGNTSFGEPADGKIHKYRTYDTTNKGPGPNHRRGAPLACIGW